MAGKTDLGRKRKNNEDALYFSEEERFAIVADGMGGLQAGEVASQMAVQTMSANLIRAFEDRKRAKGRPQEALGRLAVSCREWLHSINADLWLAATSRERKHKMGATIAFIVECADHVIVGNMGDSRVYRMRGAKLAQLSIDHSWAAESPDTVPDGEEKRSKKFVTRALGIQSRIEPEFLVEKVDRGDLFLLCSDGLMEDLKDPDLERILSKAGEDLWPAVDQLVKTELERGGPDNISVILAKAVG